jgi:hypothetical protein
MTPSVQRATPTNKQQCQQLRENSNKDFHRTIGLIPKMAKGNPNRVAGRIHGELLELGIAVSKRGI